MNTNTQNSINTVKESEVERIAQLARLALSKEEIARACEDLHSIFQHIDKLNSVDTDRIEPSDHPTELMDRWRDDVVEQVLSREQVLANAPETMGPYIVVPKVLGGSKE